MAKNKAVRKAVLRTKAKAALDHLIAGGRIPIISHATSLVLYTAQQRWSRQGNTLKGLSSVAALIHLALSFTKQDWLTIEDDPELRVLALMHFQRPEFAVLPYNWTTYLKNLITVDSSLASLLLFEVLHVTVGGLRISGWCDCLARGEQLSTLSLAEFGETPLLQQERKANAEDAHQEEVLPQPPSKRQRTESRTPAPAQEAQETGTILDHHGEIVPERQLPPAQEVLSNLWLTDNPPWYVWDVAGVVPIYQHGDDYFNNDIESWTQLWE